MAYKFLLAVGVCGTDIMKPFFNNLVKREGFQFKGDLFKDDYELVH